MFMPPVYNAKTISKLGDSISSKLVDNSLALPIEPPAAALVVAACSNAVAGVLLDRRREGVQKLLPGLENLLDVSS
jgi:hypothetical protein